MTLRTGTIIACLLTACSPRPPLTLEEKLAGKSPAVQKEILRVACLTEAGHFSNPSGEVIRSPHGASQTWEAEQTLNLKVVCREFAGEHSNGTKQ